jgi:hypothetical protein
MPTMHISHSRLPEGQENGSYTKPLPESDINHEIHPIHSSINHCTCNQLQFRSDQDWTKGPRDSEREHSQCKNRRTLEKYDPDHQG